MTQWPLTSTRSMACDKQKLGSVVLRLTCVVLYLVAALDSLHQPADKLLCHVHDIVVVSIRL